MRRLRTALLLLLLGTSVLGADAQSTPRAITVSFTTIDVPGAVYTGVFGINSAGDMVGNYGQDTNQDSHGFMYSNGTFTYFDFPGETVTVPTGINDSNLIVGYDGDVAVNSFFYDGTTFTSFQDGSDSATYANGLNNAGEVTGAAGTIYTTKGFAMLNGKFKTLNLQGLYTYVRGSGVNNLGTIVGWTDSDGFVCHGNNCAIMDYPGAFQTATLWINDAGLSVGWYTSSTCTCAFLSRKGKFLSFSYPGAAATAATGINKSGQIVGQYTFDYKAFHGFVTNPIADADFR
jgi:hypothetical protein